MKVNGHFLSHVPAGTLARLHRMCAPMLAIFLLISLTAVPEALARAGGGRNGGGGIVYLILAPFIIAYGMYVNRRINQKKQQTEAAMARMAAKDAAWDETKLEAFVRTDFLRIQRAWCAKDRATLRARLTGSLLDNWLEQLAELQAQGHTNVMENLTLAQIRFVEAKDYAGTERDEFTVCLDARAVDYTVDAAGEIVDSNATSRRARANKTKQEASFREFWTYYRKDEDWLLAKVDEADHWSDITNEPNVEAG